MWVFLMKMDEKKTNQSNENIEFPSLDILKSELKRERYKRRVRRVLRSTVNALIVVAAVAALVATLMLPVLQIAGTSMEPSLNDGDIVVLVKTENIAEIKMHKLVKIGGNKLDGKLMKVQKNTTLINVMKTQIV